MKYSLFFSVVFALLMHFSPEAKAQVKVDVKDKVNHEADNRANLLKSDPSCHHLKWNKRPSRRIDFSE